MPLVVRAPHRNASDIHRLLQDDAACAALRCDVALVSEESAPAEDLVAAEMERTDDPSARRLLCDVFDRLQFEYACGGFMPHASWIVRRIRAGAAACGVGPAAVRLEPLLRLFERVNRALFIEQTIEWLGDGAFKVHLYGEGWDRHRKFAALSRGRVENEAMRCAIRRASRINLAADPCGAVSADVTEGIAAGGFFLFRYCPADVIERLFPPIARFCIDRGITSTTRLHADATPGIRRLLELASRTLDVDLAVDWPDFVPHLLATSAGGTPRSAAAIWSDYPAVAFSSRDELLGLASRYLYDVPERLRLADAMRRQLHGRTHQVKVTVSRAFLLRGEVVAA